MSARPPGGIGRGGRQAVGGSSRADYEARLARARREDSGETVYPGEKVYSREVMRTPGRPPRILLTNVKQLELLLTRQQDIELFSWGGQSVLVRRGVRMRLVNVGASAAIGGSGEFGYPVCTVCGQSVSPLSSESQREQFHTAHAERCGHAPETLGFYADVTADSLSLPECENSTTAYSVLEAMRFGAVCVTIGHGFTNGRERPRGPCVALCGW